MDRVQLADTPHGRGIHMSDTDTTYALNGPAARPSALGDLRFAGTIAAGLVAGTLGLGALAAPLVGWKDWPSGLEKDAATTPVRLASPKAQNAPRNGRENSGRNGGVEQPGGATPLTSIGVPGGGAAGSGGFGILASVAPAASSESSTPSSTSSESDGAPSTASESSGSGDFDGVPFASV